MPKLLVLQENAKIRLEIETENTEGVFRPIGIIDEDTNFSIALEQVSSMQIKLQSLMIDLSRVKRINSCGVREWILFMERLMPQARCSFVQVNELMIEQANMVPSILGHKGTPVMSFFAPFHCARCVQDHSVLLDPSQIRFKGGLTSNAAPEVPQPPCPNCQTPMEFDWLPEEYFGFLRHL